MAERLRKRNNNNTNNNNNNSSSSSSSNQNNNNSSENDDSDNTQLAHRCEKCSSVFSRKYKLQQHYRLKHQHRCDACSKFFSSAQALTRHELTHLVKKFSCDTCEKTFSRSDTLRSHQLSAHQRGVERADMTDIILTRQCKHCRDWMMPDPLALEKMKKRKGLPHNLPPVLPPVLPDPSWRRHHIIVISTGKAYHQCTVCLELMDSCWRHHNHQRKCHSPTTEPPTKGYQCGKCWRLLGSAKTLAKHLYWTCPTLCEGFVESLSSPLRCDICFQLCPTSKFLINHQRTHSSRPKSTSTSNSTATSTK